MFLREDDNRLKESTDHLRFSQTRVRCKNLIWRVSRQELGRHPMILVPGAALGCLTKVVFRWIDVAGEKDS